MAYPRWRHILGESQRHALKAVDEWNSLTGNYGDFIGHMYRAWHYVLHSEFHRAKTDYHYRDPKTGRHVEIDGEPKAWDLDHCLKRRFPGENNPVRRNVELFGKLRNKVEHRYEHGLKIVTGGKAQALVINYEAEVVRQFGKAFSMADRLRFPVFLESITSADELRTVAAKLPKRTRDLVARFESGLDQGVLDDLRYDYRIRLVPIVGPKTDADFAASFVKLDDLTEDERNVMVGAGRTATVIIRDKHVEVADKDLMLPKQVARLVEDQAPFHFSAANNAEMWRRLKVRPPAGSDDPYQTDARYCVYDEPFRTYLYTSAWAKRILNEIGTVERYRAFFGREPRMKVGTLFDRSEEVEELTPVPADQSA
jgi:hypothetical protein